MQAHKFPNKRSQNKSMTTEPIEDALKFRASFFDERHETAFRLFNGFTEGNPDLAIDLYARTLVLHNYTDKPQQAINSVQAAQRLLLERLPWIKAAVLKTRNSQDPQEKRGQLVYGETAD